MVNNDTTLLHQTNDDINKAYQKDQPILTVSNVWRKCLHVKLCCPCCPCLVQKTNYLFKYDKKVAILKIMLDPTDNIKQV